MSIRRSQPERATAYDDEQDGDADDEADGAGAADQAEEPVDQQRRDPDVEQRARAEPDRGSDARTGGIRRSLAPGPARTPASGGQAAPQRRASSALSGNPARRSSTAGSGWRYRRRRSGRGRRRDRPADPAGRASLGAARASRARGTASRSSRCTQGRRARWSARTRRHRSPRTGDRRPGRRRPPSARRAARPPDLPDRARPRRRPSARGRRPSGRAAAGAPAPARARTPAPGRPRLGVVGRFGHRIVAQLLRPRPRGRPSTPRRPGRESRVEALDLAPPCSSLGQRDGPGGGCERLGQLDRLLRASPTGDRAFPRRPPGGRIRASASARPVSAASSRGGSGEGRVVFRERGRQIAGPKVDGAEPDVRNRPVGDERDGLAVGPRRGVEVATRDGDMPDAEGVAVALEELAAHRAADSGGVSGDGGGSGVRGTRRETPSARGAGSPTVRGSGFAARPSRRR